MIQKILVPLDGSKLATCSLPYVGEMATKLGAEVHLVTVTHRTQGFRRFDDPGSRAGELILPEGVCTIEDQAAQYLDQIARPIEAAGVKVIKQVLCGNPASEITIYATTEHCDLIIMASHGWRGPSRLIHGNVAQKVLKEAQVPVMMIQPSACKDNSPQTPSSK